MLEYRGDQDRNNKYSSARALRKRQIRTGTERQVFKRQSRFSVDEEERSERVLEENQRGCAPEMEMLC